LGIRQVPCFSVKILGRHELGGSWRAP
jgi:hypothetical protein